jgi:hypothetical protein
MAVNATGHGWRRRDASDLDGDRNDRGVADERRQNNITIGTWCSNTRTCGTKDSPVESGERRVKRVVSATSTLNVSGVAVLHR